jgi:hypothetical protein
MVDLSDYFLLVIIMSVAVAVIVWGLVSDISGRGLRQTWRDLWQTYFGRPADLPSDPSLNPKIDALPPQKNDPD